MSLDVDLTFGMHPVTGDIKIRKGVRAVLQSVREIVLTSVGDWDNEYDFGVGANSVLGENNNPIVMQNMRDKIYEQVGIHEPRADLKTVEVTPDEKDWNVLRVTVQFYVNNSLDLQTVDIPLQRLI